MTAAERDAVRLIRDLNVRIAELERENTRLRVLIKSHSTMRRKAMAKGRYWHGVALGMVEARRVP